MQIEHAITHQTENDITTTYNQDDIITWFYVERVWRYRLGWCCVMLIPELIVNRGPFAISPMKKCIKPIANRMERTHFFTLAICWKTINWSNCEIKHYLCPMLTSWIFVIHFTAQLPCTYQDDKWTKKIGSIFIAFAFDFNLKSVFFRHILLHLLTHGTHFRRRSGFSIWMNQIHSRRCLNWCIFNCELLMHKS